MIAYGEALGMVLAHAVERKTRTVPLADALGKIAAADRTSPIMVPSFRNSAMDGFAVRCADLASATVEHPITLPIVGAVAAGDAGWTVAGENTVRIMTGAPVPEGFDAVVLVEDATADTSHATFTRPVREGENIRLAGEDVRAGQGVLRQGDRITAERLMLLAAVGIAAVEVHALPELLILSTGREVTDDLGQPLPEGRIYNSNAPYLVARCQEEGVAARYGGIIADDPVAFKSHLRAAPPGSVIVTTGAVSKGVWDFIPESLGRLGATTHFHRVNIRPGKPVLFATLPNGNRFFGLPGNPISAAVGFRFFVLPLLRALQGLSPELPLTARLAQGVTKKGDFRQFLKGMLTFDASGQLTATASTGQESFKIASMAESNGWIVLEEDQRELSAGVPVAVLPYRSFGERFVCKTV